MCETYGRGEVLVINGNMKNGRQVCAVKDITTFSFESIQGEIRTGIYSFYMKHSLKIK